MSSLPAAAGEIPSRIWHRVSARFSPSCRKADRTRRSAAHSGQS